MKQKIYTLVVMLAVLLFAIGNLAVAASLNPNPPTSPVKFIFIHHSSGENWLNDEHGGLGVALQDNNYFVSDTNYGWGPDSIGDRTDIGNWWEWFRGSNSTTYCTDLYAESGQNAWYSRLPTDPGGENEIIMFKSCFPNSYLSGNQNDPPITGNNPLRGQDAYSEYMTVANAKGIYNDILTYFATRQDRLFIVITAPPQGANDTDATHAANARAFNNWLVNDWLDSYSYNNVAVFDFYNVLTSNAGNPNTNDAGQTAGNHHRWWNNAIQHIQTVSNNMSAYPSDPWDSHPSAAGNQKATDEFIELLNIWYHRWQGTETTVPQLNVGGITTDLSNSPSVAQNVQISFTATGQTSPLSYRYWQATGYQTSNYGHWQTYQTWSNNTSFTWAPGADDHYVIVVYVTEDQNSGVFHQAGLSIETSGNSTNPVQVTSFTTDMAYPQQAGTPINLSTTAIGGNAPLQYKYWYQFNNGPWISIRDWNASSEAPWVPSQAGQYILIVWVSDDTSEFPTPLAGMTCTISD